MLFAAAEQAHFMEECPVCSKVRWRSIPPEMLGNDPIIDLGFTYIDGQETASVKKDELLRCLTTG